MNHPDTREFEEHGVPRVFCGKTRCTLARHACGVRFATPAPIGRRDFVSDQFECCRGCDVGEAAASEIKAAPAKGIACAFPGCTAERTGKYKFCAHHGDAAVRSNELSRIAHEERLAALAVGDISRVTEDQGRVLLYLDEHKDGLTPSAIGVRLGRGRSQASTWACNVMKELVDAGVIRRVSGGPSHVLYRLAKEIDAGCLSGR